MQNFEAATNTPSRPSAIRKPAFTEKRFTVLLALVTSLFLLWGIAITMGDVLNRHFQNVLHVSKAQSGLVQFSIFGAYFVMGLPAGLFLKRYGYKNGVLLGLGLYALGAFLFVPAADSASFSLFRMALFVLACGLATLETVAHPFVAALGDQRTSDQRINFAQSFNGLGAMIGPMIGTYFLLRSTEGPVADGLDSVKFLYIGIGCFIAAVALLFLFVRVPHLKNRAVAAGDQPMHHESGKKRARKTLFQHRHFRWAVVAQFFNVAAQGGTWAFFINYGIEKMGFTDEQAGYYLSLFMGMMVLGRFAGTFLMRFVAPNRLLAVFAVANVLLCIVVAQGWGWTSFVALLFINFFFSIMFPTIFSLGLKDMGEHTEQASSFLVMGVVGGAVFPPLMGLIADRDIATAYYLPILCYGVIFLFATRFYKANAERR